MIELLSESNRLSVLLLYQTVLLGFLETVRTLLMFALIPQVSELQFPLYCAGLLYDNNPLVADNTDLFLEDLKPRYISEENR